MKQTTLENIGNEIEVEHSSDEIQTMNIAYNNLMRRLNEAALREKSLAHLQIQTQFDALQAQINPHFIFNVLNMISQRGLLSGDETVCEICDKLAGMLRYSTGTSQRVVTIQTELDHVRQYFYLLKARYREKLKCSINIDPAILNEPIPKIVLQQIAENAINHGFKDHSGEMCIAINGGLENGYWILRVIDNGSGFDERDIRVIKSKLKDINMKLAQGDDRIGFDFGGMGLINTYARMRLIFGDDIVFQFYNKTGENVGAVVEIGALAGGEVPE
jgi:two-component system sensor histidine kinase YesM